MVRDRKPDGAGIEADPTLDWFLAQLQGSDVSAERLALRPPVVRSRPAPRTPIRRRLVQPVSRDDRSGPTTSAAGFSGAGSPVAADHTDATDQKGAADQTDAAPTIGERTDAASRASALLRPVAARRTLPRPIAARGSIASGRVSGSHGLPDAGDPSTGREAAPDDAQTDMLKAPVPRAPARRPAPLRRTVAGAQLPGLARAADRRPIAAVEVPSVRGSDGHARGAETVAVDSALGAETVTPAVARGADTDTVEPARGADTDLVEQVRGVETVTPASARGADTDTVGSARPQQTSSEDAGAAAPTGDASTTHGPFGAASLTDEHPIESDQQAPPRGAVASGPDAGEPDAGEPVATERVPRDAGARGPAAGGPDPGNGPKPKRAAATAPPRRVVDLQRRSTTPLPAFPVDAPASLPDGAVLDAEVSGEAGDPGRVRERSIVPDPERSTPKSAIAHVAIVEQELQTDATTDRRSRALVPQLFAATVIGFIVVAGAIGVLQPPERSSQPASQTETVPAAPVDPGPSITPAPTQTPELVIPSIPLDVEPGGSTGALGSINEDETTVPGAAGSPTESGIDAAAIVPPGSPTGGSPAAGGSPEATTPDGPGWGAAPARPGVTVPGEVAPPVPVPPPADEVVGSGGGAGSVIGVIVDIVEEILPRPPAGSR